MNINYYSLTILWNPLMGIHFGPLQWKCPAILKHWHYFQGPVKKLLYDFQLHSTMYLLVWNEFNYCFQINLRNLFTVKNKKKIKSKKDILFLRSVLIDNKRTYSFLQRSTFSYPLVIFLITVCLVVTTRQ